jgi:hypothetical protein
MKILVPVKRVVDYNVKIRVKPNTVHLGMWKAYAVGRGFGARLRWLVHLPAFRLASV